MTGGSAARYVHFGEFRLDVERGQLFRGGEPVAVQSRALDTLVVLVRHRDRVVGKSELLDAVWPDAHVEEANLTQQVFTLRRILGDDTEHPRFIATLPRRGYRFIADVVQEPLDRRNGHPDANGPVVEATADPTTPAGEGNRPVHLGAGRRWLGWTVIIACGALAASPALRTSVATPDTGTRSVIFQIGLPDEMRLLPSSGLPGLSPDGQVVAFAAERAGGVPMVFLRPLDSTRVRPVPGTERASAAFWSHDGRRLGFFAGGKLRTVPLDGGVVSDVCDVEDQRGGTWGADGTIVFAAGSRSVLYRVAASGGIPDAITHMDASRRDISHRYPSFLPGGRRFIFQVWSGDVDRQGIYAGEIGSPAIRRIAAEPSPAVWFDDHVLFVHREALVAQPFDNVSLKPSGEIVTVASPVARAPSDYAAFSATRGGITYVQSRFEARLIWRDRGGREIAEVGGPGQYDSPAVSRDGRRVLFAQRDRARGLENLDVWLADLDGRNRVRVTFDGSVDIEPTWSPDGREVVFRSNRSGFSDLYRKQLDTNLPESLLYGSRSRKDVGDWSPDGKTIVFSVETAGAESDLWTLPIAAPGHAAPLVTGPGAQTHAQFSPDGRLVAYQSSENGVDDVLVQSLGASRRRWRIANGQQPSWRADGRELLFVVGGAIASADVRGRGDATAFGPPHRLFDVQLSGVVRNAYAITPDGQRFLLIEPVEQDAPPALTVLLDPPF